MQNMGMLENKVNNLSLTVVNLQRTVLKCLNEIELLNMEVKKMSKLTTKARSKLPKKEFGLPGSEKYPMPDKSHAANAKARATQMVKKGKLSEASKEKIDAKANKVLKGKKK